jgi:DNA repair exonuclease SbcCD ATPase subunit
MAPDGRKKAESQGLKSIFIRHFQSHKKSKLVFHPGINVITGKSHEGKTAILRAINKLVYNRPRGAKFYSNFAPMKGITKISATFFDGCKVTLENVIRKTKKDEKTVKKCLSQKYLLRVPGSKEKSFSGLKTSIPDQVINTLNLVDLNFQFQHDPPLLLKTSNLKLTKLVSDITRLDRAFTVKKTLQTRLSDATTKEKVLSENVKRLQKEFDKYKDLDKLDNVISNLGMEELKRNKISDKISILMDAYSSLLTLDTKIKIIEKGINDLGTIGEQIGTERMTISDIINDEKNLRTSYKIIKQIRHINRVVPELVSKYKNTLVEMEKCPTCGQSTTEL